MSFTLGAVLGLLIGGVIGFAYGAMQAVKADAEREWTGKCPDPRVKK